MGFGFRISPSNEYPGLISFSIDCFDLLEVQGSLKSLLQHHCSKASILQHSAFFMAQLSHPYMTIGKTIALAMWTSVGKVTSLLFNMLSWLVIAFFPRSKHRSQCKGNWPHRNLILGTPSNFAFLMSHQERKIDSCTRNQHKMKHISPSLNP